VRSGNQTASGVLEFDSEQAWLRSIHLEPIHAAFPAHSYKETARSTIEATNSLPLTELIHFHQSY